MITDISGMIFGHILDSYEWHFTDIGDTKIVLYLPCIVKSETTGWHVFSSSHLYHPEGAVYEGFQIAESGSNEGKIIEVATGERPLDISITKNALALVDRGAALMVRDIDCDNQCLPRVLELFESTDKRESMSVAIKGMAARGAADKIVDQIERILK